MASDKFSIVRRKKDHKGDVNEHVENLSESHKCSGSAVQALNRKKWFYISVRVNILAISLLFVFLYISNFHVFDHEVPKNDIQQPENQCLGRGRFDEESKKCKCYSCFEGSDCTEIVPRCDIHVDRGDPTMYETYWLKNAETADTYIRAHDLTSYFSNRDGLCWFMEPALEKEIRTLHRLVGNAVTEGRYIVVGTGSSQLFQAALYALSNQELTTSVVASAPYYSVYPLISNYLQTSIYKWAGTIESQPIKKPYIEIITSPNNPDGEIRHAVFNGSDYHIYDLAYYWPQYTPITSQIDEDVMLFALSKSTGHAGSRIGWAIVKRKDVAKRMVKVIELSTIGVSKDSQIRASQILKHINENYEKNGKPPYQLGYESVYQQHSKFFHYGYLVMEYRWKRINEALNGGNRFSLPQFQPMFCNFFGQKVISHPAFAWIKCEIEEDCQQVLEAKGIQTRGGRHFGYSPKYTRVSMVEHDPYFEILIERLSAIKNI